MSRTHSPAYDVCRDERDDWFAIVNRRDGMHVLHDAAAFVTDHMAQGERLDFTRLCRAYRDEVTFTVTGARGDVLEGHQTIIAVAREERDGAVSQEVHPHPRRHAEPQSSE